MKKTNFSINVMAKIGILSAIATVLMLIEFPLWFAPSFYKLDFSEVAVLIGGFALGPVAGIFIELIKIILNFFINGTMTGGVGELSNLLIGCAFVVPASLIYKYRKSMKGAIIGIVTGIIAMTVLGSIMNWFVILPMYSSLGLMPMEAIINAGNVLNKYIVDIKSFVFFAVTPFNFFKGVVVGIPTLLIYLPLQKILNKNSGI